MASGDDEAECPACGRQVYQAEAYLAGKVFSKSKHTFQVSVFM